MAYALPNVAGIPPLLGGLLPVALPPLVTSDQIGFLPSFAGPQWGIFLGGAPVVPADNVVSMDARQEWVIADYPIEQGAFESYDKVKRPFDVRFRLSTGGSVAARAAMIAAIKAIAGDFNLYMFVSPEDTWENVNVSHFDYNRRAESVGLFSVDVWGWQIQVNQTSGLSNTAQPDGADPSVNTVSSGAGNSLGFPALGIPGSTASGGIGYPALSGQFDAAPENTVATPGT